MELTYKQFDFKYTFLKLMTDAIFTALIKFMVVVVSQIMHFKYSTNESFLDNMAEKFSDAIIKEALIQLLREND